MVNLKKRPQYNIDGTFEASHQKRKTGVAFDIGYGGNRQDQTKRVTLVTTFEHQIISWPESTMSVDFDLKHLGMVSSLTYNIQMILHILKL